MFGAFDTFYRIANSFMKLNMKFGLNDEGGSGSGRPSTEDEDEKKRRAQEASEKLASTTVYSNANNIAYELVRTMDSKTPNIVTFREPNDTSNQHGFVRETKGKDGKYTYEVVQGKIPTASDKTYTIKIPRLENGKHSKTHFDELTLDRNGEEIDRKLARAGDSQLSQVHLSKAGPQSSGADISSNEVNPIIGKKAELNGKRVEVTKFYKTLGDGNCAFRALRGGDFLMNEELATRKDVIADLKRGLKNPEIRDVVKEFIARDIEGYFIDREDREAPLPDYFSKELKDHVALFYDNDSNPLINASPAAKERISKEFKDLTQSDKVIAEYLDQHFVNEAVHPTMEGIVKAYAIIHNIEPICWTIGGIFSAPNEEKAIWETCKRQSYIFHEDEHFSRIDVEPEKEHNQNNTHNGEFAKKHRADVQQKRERAHSI